MEVQVMLRRTRPCALVLAFGGALGCDPGPARLDDSGDTGFLPVLNSAIPMATQVGSEGFWGCPIEELRPTSPDERIDALGGTPAGLTAGRVGSWPLAIAPVGGTPLAGTLDLADAGSYRIADVSEGAGCEDYLVSAVTATLTRDAVPRALVGFVAVRPGGGRVLLADSGDLGELAALWGPPTLTGAIGFRIEGDLDPAVIDGVAAYVDCADPMASCPGSETVAEVDGTR